MSRQPGVSFLYPSFIRVVSNKLAVLSQRGYFEDPKFVAYLEYLRYLNGPPYIYFFRYALPLPYSSHA